MRCGEFRAVGSTWDRGRGSAGDGTDMGLSNHPVGLSRDGIAYKSWSQVNAERRPKGLEKLAKGEIATGADPARAPALGYASREV